MYAVNLKCVQLKLLSSYSTTHVLDLLPVTTEIYLTDLAVSTQLAHHMWVQTTLRSNSCSLCQRQLAL